MSKQTGKRQSSRVARQWAIGHQLMTKAFKKFLYGHKDHLEEAHIRGEFDGYYAYRQKARNPYPKGKRHDTYERAFKYAQEESDHSAYQWHGREGY